jgi:hypothetical protein
LQEKQHLQLSILDSELWKSTQIGYVKLGDELDTIASHPVGHLRYNSVAMRQGRSNSDQRQQQNQQGEAAECPFIHEEVPFVKR